MRVARQNQGDDAFRMLAHTRTDAQQALKLLAPHGLTLTQATQFYLDNIDVIQNAKTYSETVAELLHAKEQDGKSARYLQDMRNRLKSAEPIFGIRLLHTIKAAELDDYLRSLDVAGVTRNNFRRLFSVLFGYGVTRRYCLKNPATQVDVVTVERGKPPILSVPEARALMSNLEPELVAAVALALFAGLRPEAEIFAADHRLDWQHIDLEDRTIDIDKSKNVGSHRYVKIQDNLLKWLDPHIRKAGPSVKSTTMAAFRRPVAGLSKVFVKPAKRLQCLKRGRAISCDIHTPAIIAQPLKTPDSPRRKWDTAETCRSSTATTGIA